MQVFQEGLWGLSVCLCLRLLNLVAHLLLKDPVSLWSCDPEPPTLSRVLAEATLLSFVAIDASSSRLSFLVQRWLPSGPLVRQLVTQAHSVPLMKRASYAVFLLGRTRPTASLEVNSVRAHMALPVALPVAVVYTGHQIRPVTVWRTSLCFLVTSTACVILVADRGVHRRDYIELPRVLEGRSVPPAR